jgi:DNA-binding CsgD family transcriptional regulator
MTIALNSQGYRILWKPLFYDADTSGRVRFHRYKYSLLFNSRLTKQEAIHHVDGNRLNNMKSNLKRMTQSEHSGLESFNRNHRQKRYARKLYMECDFSHSKIAGIMDLAKNTISFYLEDLTGIKEKLLQKRCLELRRRGLFLREIARIINRSIASVHVIIYKKTGDLDRHWVRKLTQEQVHFIKTSNLTNAQVAKILNINPSTVSRTKNGLRNKGV